MAEDCRPELTGEEMKSENMTLQRSLYLGEARTTQIRIRAGAISLSEVFLLLHTLVPGGTSLSPKV
jgi:hypothetical protein